MSTHLNRREFLGAAAATAAAASIGRAQEAAMPAGLCQATGYTPTKVLRVFIGANPAWPSPDLDFDAEIKSMKAETAKVKGLEDITFVGDVLVRDVESLKKVLAEHKDVDGVLAMQVALGTSGMLNLLADSGIPTIQFATPYSGHEWCIVPDLMAKGKKIDSIPTSNYADIAVAVRPFRALHRMRETRILYVSGGRAAPEGIVEEVKKKFGTEIITFDHKALVAAYEAVKPEAAKADCERWVRNAEAVKEPPREEILKSARMCLALQKVLADERAQAITINCLGLFGQKALPAYPCFGFARLNDLGLTGVCEADLSSTLTQVLYLHLTGKPGFVTDPVFDTSNDTVIHAHCVSATKMDGPAGESAPYVIRTHLEDHAGAVLQVKMRVGQEVTMAKLVGGKRTEMPTQLAASPPQCLATGTMLLSTGTIVGVPDVDRGCRTKIAVKVADARKMFEQWSYGLHRVIFYGNHVADTRRLARFAGFQIVEEC